MTLRVPFYVWYLVFDIISQNLNEDILHWKLVCKLFNRVAMTWEKNMTAILQQKINTTKCDLSVAKSKSGHICKTCYVTYSVKTLIVQGLM